MRTSAPFGYEETRLNSQLKRDYPRPGAKGRDHDHYGYTAWLAGGGVKQGVSYATVDEFSCSTVENRFHIHALHAAILPRMGLDHEHLTYRYSGRDYRLTDVADVALRDGLKPNLQSNYREAA